jgi:hypothetical protein
VEEGGAVWFVQTFSGENQRGGEREATVVLGAFQSSHGSVDQWGVRGTVTQIRKRGRAWHGWRAVVRLLRPSGYGGHGSSDTVGVQGK